MASRRPRNRREPPGTRGGLAGQEPAGRNVAAATSPGALAATTTGRSGGRGARRRGQPPPVDEPTAVASAAGSLNPEPTAQDVRIISQPLVPSIVAELSPPAESLRRLAPPHPTQPRSSGAPIGPSAELSATLRSDPRRQDGTGQGGRGQGGRRRP